MEKKSKYFFNNASSYVGVGTAIGVAMHAATSEPTWIAVGAALGAALSWRGKG